MQTLVIYDGTGYIIQQMSGNVREPVGIPFLWIEAPEGKMLTDIDVTDQENPVPIFKDMPIPPIVVLQEELAEVAVDADYRLSLLELGLI